MTYQSTGGALHIPNIVSTAINPSAPGFSSVTVDATGEGIAFIFEAPATDTITKIGFRTGLVTTTGDLRISVQTVTSGFLPTGTDWATDTFIVQNVLSTDDNVVFEVTLTAAASVTQGDFVALVVERPAGSAFVGALAALVNGSVFMHLGRPTSAANTGSWGVASSIPNIWPYFGSGGYLRTSVQNGVSDLTSVSYSTGTTPDVVGNVIRFPYDVKVSHIFALVDFDGPVDFQILDSDGSTVLASTSNTANTPTSATLTLNYMQLSSEVELSANTDYRVVAVPSSSTSVAIYDIIFHAADLRETSLGAEFCYKTSAKDPTGAGDFTDLTTTVVPIGVRVSAIDIPTGGGGGLAANPIKGFIG